jgi:hypothetical protein
MAASTKKQFRSARLHIQRERSVPSGRRKVFRHLSFLQLGKNRLYKEKIRHRNLSILARVRRNYSRTYSYCA